jgi:hypothetical protein
MSLPRTALLLAGALTLAGGGYAVAQSAAIGVASAVIKDVRFSNAASPKPKPVTLKQRIALGDLIQTGKASQLQLLLLDRSSFSIGANASLRIDRFVYDPARGRGAGAGVARGAFRFMSGNQSRGNSATITTPVATIGIRGTILDGLVGEAVKDVLKGEIKQAKDAKADKQSATLVVLRGPGARTDPGAEVGAASVTSGGVTVELTGPMQAAYVPRAGAAPIGPFRLSPGGLALLQDQVFPAQASKGGGGLLGGILKVLPLLPAVTGGGGRTPSGGNGPAPDPAGQPGKP